MWLTKAQAREFRSCSSPDRSARRSEYELRPAEQHGVNHLSKIIASFPPKDVVLARKDLPRCGVKNRIIHTHTAKAEHSAEPRLFFQCSSPRRRVRVVHTFHGHFFAFYSRLKTRIFVLRKAPGAFCDARSSLFPTHSKIHEQVGIGLRIIRDHPSASISAPSSCCEKRPSCRDISEFVRGDRWWLCRPLTEIRCFAVSPSRRLPSQHPAPEKFGYRRGDGTCARAWTQAL